jgi:hypothetical protein
VRTPGHTVETRTENLNSKGPRCNRFFTIFTITLNHDFVRLRVTRRVYMQTRPTLLPCTLLHGIRKPPRSKCHLFINTNCTLQWQRHCACVRNEGLFRFLNTLAYDCHSNISYHVHDNTESATTDLVTDLRNWYYLFNYDFQLLTLWKSNSVKLLYSYKPRWKFNGKVSFGVK